MEHGKFISERIMIFDITYSFMIRPNDHFPDASRIEKGFGNSSIPRSDFKLDLSKVWYPIESPNIKYTVKEEEYLSRELLLRRMLDADRRT